MVNSRTRRSATLGTVYVALISITVASDLLPSEIDDSSIVIAVPQHAEGGVIAQSRHSHLRRHHTYNHHRREQHVSFLSRIVSLLEGRLFPAHTHGESEKDDDERFTSRKHSANGYDHEIMDPIRALQQDTENDVKLLDTSVSMTTKAEEQWCESTCRSNTPQTLFDSTLSSTFSLSLCTSFPYLINQTLTGLRLNAPTGIHSGVNTYSTHKNHVVVQC
jgi:hypothetical protein